MLMALEQPFSRRHGFSRAKDITIREDAPENLRHFVLNNDFRHPVLVAREAATVDLLTEGRLQLGLGAGYVQSEYEQAGLDFDAGGIRVERLAEAVTLIKGLLKGEQVTLAGRHYRVTGHTIYPLPVQQPHPPILIGGNGRNLLTLAAREGDIVGFSGITFRRGGAIYDARPVAAQLSLDSEGLALFDHKSAMRDFYDEDELRRVYYPEAERLVAEVTGASRVLVVDHTFEAMNRAIALHRLRPVIDRAFPFAEAKAAYRHFEGRGHFGKVVIAHV
jgi:hypothetical protein